MIKNIQDTFDKNMDIGSIVPTHIATIDKSKINDIDKWEQEQYVIFLIYDLDHETNENSYDI